MNIATIKALIDAHSLEALKQAENDLLDEKPLSIAVEGKDEGEQLTHLLAAIWCKHEMEKQGWPINTAIRNYSQRVRNSIT